MIQVEEHIWQPDFPNVINIIEKDSREEFEITLKEESDIEINFSWDYGYGGRGSKTMFISAELLKELIKKIY